MPLTSTELQTSIDALLRAVARGELTVEYADRRVTYRSVAELRDALATLRAELASVQATGPGGVLTQSYAAYSSD